ncbi:MAG: ABC transporter permease [Chloroflexi bacterium HGW-Chloroflexi-2]|nr:MAG: ABC transporter permease [Chloroflexi bacterium HGW-Chloroflexi-2]
MVEPISKKRSGLKLFIMTVFGRSYPRLVGMQRERSWIFFDIFVPLLSVSAYVFVYRAIGAPEDYVGFVVVGGAMTAFWMNILWNMSSQLYWEKEQGNLALYIISPASMMAILLGMALGGLFATLLRAIAIMIFGSLIFNVSYYVVSFWQLIAIFSLSMIALYGLGMMSASIFLLLSREAWHISNLATEPVYLLSGMYFPVKNLGFWGSAFGSLIPLTLGLDAIRQLIFKSGPSLGFLSVKIEIISLIILSIIYLIAAKFLLAHIEKLAMREGRLTENRR